MLLNGAEVKGLSILIGNFICWAEFLNLTDFSNLKERFEISCLDYKKSVENRVF